MSYGEEQEPGLLVCNLMLGVSHRSGTHGLPLDNIYHHQAPVAFFYIPYECSGSLHRCCDGSDTSVGPGNVLLLQGRSLVAVSLFGLSPVVLSL